MSSKLSCSAICRFRLVSSSVVSSSLTALRAVGQRRRRPHRPAPASATGAMFCAGREPSSSSSRTKLKLRDLRLRGADLGDLDRVRRSAPRRSRRCTATATRCRACSMSMPYTSFRPGPQTGCPGSPGRGPRRGRRQLRPGRSSWRARAHPPSPGARRSRPRRCPASSRERSGPRPRARVIIAACVASASGETSPPSRLASPPR